MAIRMFLTIDKNAIAGESTADGYKDQMEVLSWSWGMTQSGSAHVSGGTSTAAVSVGDLSVVKYLDKATPVLIKYCCAGTFFDKAKLTVLKSGEKAMPYLEIELQHGLVSSSHQGGVGPDERLIETVTFNFKSFTIGYTPQKDGKPQAIVPAGWDIAANKPQ